MLDPLEIIPQDDENNKKKSDLQDIPEFKSRYNLVADKNGMTPLLKRNSRLLSIKNIKQFGIKYEKILKVTIILNFIEKYQ